MIKRMIRNVLFCMGCMVCMVIFCECEDEDDDHHDHDANDHHQASLREDVQHIGIEGESLALPAVSLNSTIADACENDVYSIVSSTNLARENGEDAGAETKEQLRY